MQINSHKPPLRRDQWLQIGMNADDSEDAVRLFAELEGWLPDGVAIEGTLARIRAAAIDFVERPDTRELSRRA